MSLRHVVFGRSLTRTLGRALVLGAVIVIVSLFWLSPIRAHGDSMLPTYREGELLVVNWQVYRFGAPERGDVVAIRLAGGGAYLVKRVIGLPGERVRIQAGVVHIDDRPLAEPYVQFRGSWNIPEVVLGSGELFIVGDNRGMAAREHDFGRVAADRVRGRVVF